eukprot:12214266-Karenia_brevis.AAC.1
MAAKRLWRIIKDKVADKTKDRYSKQDNLITYDDQDLVKIEAPNKDALPISLWKLPRVRDLKLDIDEIKEQWIATQRRRKVDNIPWCS